MDLATGPVCRDGLGRRRWVGRSVYTLPHQVTSGSDSDSTVPKQKKRREREGENEKKSEREREKKKKKKVTH